MGKHLSEVLDAEKYYGKYVCIARFSKGIEVVAYNKDLLKVIKKAREKGLEPKIVYVPDPKYDYTFAFRAA